MSFHSIPYVEDPSALIDVVFRRTKDVILRGKRRQKRKQSSIYALRRAEQKRLDILVRAVIKRLESVVSTFPEVSQLNEFYKEMTLATIDEARYERSIRACRATAEQIQRLRTEYARRINRLRDVNGFHAIRKSFYGRVSSFVKRLGESFDYLNQVRAVMKTYPIIKKMPTVAIAGFPNVGKTTLLSKLSSSKPEIAEYAFTTKHINVGYLCVGSREIQLLDTPGTLARPAKMNAIEKQAYLALRHLAQVIVYVFDPTEPYPLERQEQLLVLVQKEDKPIFLYMSKVDIAKAQAVATLKRLHPEIISEPQALVQQLFAELR